jgi:succinate-semialdehyde dehydrogenase / glutarate-semialdehyde dehydrogenase
MLKSTNPATGQVLQEYLEMSDLEVQTALAQSAEAYRGWRATAFPERSRCMYRLADLLLEQKVELARLMTAEMGKTHREAEAEVEKCAWVCRHYAEMAETYLGPETIETEMTQSVVVCQPVGAVLAVMPWNFPFWQVFRFAAPALMAGNVGLLKHAPNVCGCALAIESLFHSAGFPKGTFRTLLIRESQVELVIADDAVQAVTLTGSVRAGSAVASLAGRYLKKSVMELGGNDPYLILYDADCHLAAQKCVQSRMLNAGQSCIGAKRILVLDSVYQEFMGHLTSEIAARKVGDPTEAGSDLGPMVSLAARDTLHIQVTESIEKGATCLLGGQLLPGDGAFYPPTLLADVRPGMPAFDEELFGPVVSVVRVTDVEEAIALANTSEFGLGGAIFTRDHELAMDIATKRLESGCCAVNDFVKSDPRLPFGGIKKSGYGRELSHNGIREFVNLKTVTLA